MIIDHRPENPKGQKINSKSVMSNSQARIAHHAKHDEQKGAMARVSIKFIHFLA